MTLTEHLKKGKLKEGKYYVKTQEDNICELMFDDEGHWYDFGWDCWLGDDYVKEVLAPVPSYDEMKLVALKIDVISEKIAELSVENQQLKELLKECRPYVTQCVSRNFYEDDVSLRDRHLNKDFLLTKIDEVLK